MAAKLSKYPLRGLNTKEMVLVVGCFTPDTNTSYPHSIALATRTNGAQFSVSKTAAGTYVLTMSDKYTTCLQFDLALVGQAVLPSAATGAALQVTASQYGYPAANQVTVRIYNPATALVSSDITAVEPASVPTGCSIQFTALMRVTGSPD